MKIIDELENIVYNGDFYSNIAQYVNNKYSSSFTRRDIKLFLLEWSYGGMSNTFESSKSIQDTISQNEKSNFTIGFIEKFGGKGFIDFKYRGPQKETEQETIEYEINGVIYKREVPDFEWPFDTVE